VKKIILVILFLSAIALIFVTTTLRHAPPTADTVTINDAVISARQVETADEAANLLIDALIYAFAEAESVQLAQNHRLRVFLCVFVAIIAIIAVALCLFIEFRFLTPFRKMKNFAYNIAAGRLDTPLEMDRSNMFGAFTESFDLMREELHKARESETAANKSKKELVATLSHDIKTPVASIKAVTELMLAMQPGEKDRSRLATITEKAEQINSLITNMFHATLEELHALTVTPAEITSTEVSRLISTADYSHRAHVFVLPECVVIADPLRLQQVFDNIFANAYKYANTDMYIASRFCERGEHLVIEIKDLGQGVQADDLPLIFNKFFRAKNVERISGHGLGLHIAKYFMQEMSGDLEAETHADGFVMRVLIKLA